MNSGSIFKVLGIAMIGLALAMLLPLLLSISQNDDISRKSFSAAFCVSAFLGTLLVLSTRGQPAITSRREIVAAVAALVLITTVTGSLPLYFSGEGWNFLDSNFESLSGFTTTGISMKADPSTLSDSILLWRALLQWIGGFSSLLLVIWAFPTFGFGGIFVPQRDAVETIVAERQASFQQLIRNLLLIYSSLTLFCICILVSLNVPTLQAVCYSLSTISTGGFILDQNGPLTNFSIPIKLTLSLFMILGAINFLLLGKILTSTWKQVFFDSEIRILFGLILVGIVLILISSNVSKEERSVIDGIFLLISILTTTGYPVDNYTIPTNSFLILILLTFAFIGGSSGSTTGGLKLMRLTLLFQQARRELIKLIHPHAVIPIKFGLHPVNNSFVHSVWVFFISFISVLVFIVIVLSFFSVDLISSMTMAIISLTNGGPALMHGINFELTALTPLAKLVLMAGMLLGRLEFLILLILFNLSFWKP